MNKSNLLKCHDSHNLLHLIYILYKKTKVLKFILQFAKKLIYGY